MRWGGAVDIHWRDRVQPVFELSLRSPSFYLGEFRCHIYSGLIYISIYVVYERRAILISEDPVARST